MLNYLENRASEKIELENNYIERKITLKEASYFLRGPTLSGKTFLVKNYLLTLQESTYLYLDLQDIRIDIIELNVLLENFCIENEIKTLVIDNYQPTFQLFTLHQIILITKYPSSNINLPSHFIPLSIQSLDYEEFLAYEQKFDYTALNHYLKIGGLPAMHFTPKISQAVFLQTTLRSSLNTIEFLLMIFIAKNVTNKISAFSLYEKMKKEVKISKDKLYLSLSTLYETKYLYKIEKFNHPKAVQKIYFAEIAYQLFLASKKNFNKLFENMVFLHLQRHSKKIYYFEGIDFYIPSKNKIVFALAFSDARRFFQKIETIEAFIFQYKIDEIVCVTLNTEATLTHPLSSIEMIPFSVWALLE